MMVDSLAVKFYGCGGASMWFTASPDATNWGPYQSINLPGGDPAVLKIPGRNYLIIYTGPPATSSISSASPSNEIILFPNPVQNSLRLSGLTPGSSAAYHILNLQGRECLSGFLNSGPDEIYVGELPQGIYLLKINQADGSSKKLFYILR